MGKARKPSLAKVADQVRLPVGRPAATGGVSLSQDAMGDLAAYGNEVAAQAVSEAVGSGVASAAPGGGGAPAAAPGGAPDPTDPAAAIQNARGGGAPLPEAVRGQMEEALGHDFSGVRVHRDDPSMNAFGAHAAALGNDIFFAPGMYSPGTAQGDGLLAEELAHVKQVGGAAPKGNGMRLGATTSSHESEAGEVRKAVESGADKIPDVAAGTAGPDVLRRASAGVHQAIEMDATNTEHAGLMTDMEKNTDDLSEQQRAALQMYAGNWMRDFSQLNTPASVEALKGLPLHLGDAKSTAVVGAKGAESLLNGVIKAFSIIELGKEISDGVVNPQNVGAYQGQDHIDNPMGVGAGDFTIRDSEIGTLKAAVEPSKRGDVDPDTKAQMAGASDAGLQFMNPNLYKASSTGIANHVYNSTEYSKGQLIQAAKAGEGPIGRAHLGASQHLVEDYFSHTNVIEVALNRYIDSSLAQRKAGQGAGFSDGKNQLLDKMTTEAGQGGAYWVDTLYDEKVTSEEGQERQVITSGTFGGLDTKMSLAHVLLPAVPKVEAAMLTAVDRVFGLLAKGPDAPRDWNAMMAEVGNDRPMNALDAVARAADEAGMTLPIPTGLDVVWKDVAISPGFFGDPWTVSVPGGVEMSSNPVPFTKGMSVYMGTYKRAQEMIDTFKKYTKWIDVTPLIEKVRALINGALAGIREAMKQKVRQMLRAMVAQVAGVDPAEAADSDIRDLVDLADTKVEEAEVMTSLGSRMGNEKGDLYNVTHGMDDKQQQLNEEQRAAARERLEMQLGPLKGSGTREDPWLPVASLPPSHTEINKDHGKKEVENGSGETIAEGGSVFYGISRALSIEADRHIMNQLSRVWGSNVLGGERGDDLQTDTGRDQVLTQADAVALKEGRRAKESGQQFVQNDVSNQEYLRSNPQAGRLLNLVDVLMGHPDDSTWWHATMDSYVSGNADEVYAHIQARNQTRKKRV